MNQLALADILRDEAIDRTQAKNSLGVQELGLTIAWLAFYEKPFTADDVWAMYGERPPELTDPRALGAAFRKAQKEGLIEPDGWEKCTRASRHGAPIRRWRAKK